jgi:hypothetical protein
LAVATPDFWAREGIRGISVTWKWPPCDSEIDRGAGKWSIAGEFDSFEIFPDR